MQEIVEDPLLGEDVRLLLRGDNLLLVDALERVGVAGAVAHETDEAERALAEGREGLEIAEVGDRPALAVDGDGVEGVGAVASRGGVGVLNLLELLLDSLHLLLLLRLLLRILLLLLLLLLLEILLLLLLWLLLGDSVLLLRHNTRRRRNNCRCVVDVALLSGIGRHGARDNRGVDAVLDGLALEDVHNGPQEQLERVAVQPQALDLAHSHRRGRAGLVVQQRQLAEVGPGAQRHRGAVGHDHAVVNVSMRERGVRACDGIWRRRRRRGRRGRRDSDSAVDDDVHGITGVALGEDGRLGREVDRVHGLGNAAALELGQRRQKRDPAEEVDALFELLCADRLGDGEPREAVQHPQHRVRGRRDRGGARGRVEQRQLAEVLARGHGPHGARDAVGTALGDCEGAVLDDVELRAEVTLGHDGAARRDGNGKHCQNQRQAVVQRHAGEERAARQRRQDRRAGGASKTKGKHRIDEYVRNLWGA